MVEMEFVVGDPRQLGEIGKPLQGVASLLTAMDEFAEEYYDSFPQLAQAVDKSADLLQDLVRTQSNVDIRKPQGDACGNTVETEECRQEPGDARSDSEQSSKRQFAVVAS